MDAVRNQLNLFLLWFVSAGVVCLPGALMAQDLPPEATSSTVTEEETPILFGHNQLKTKLRMSWGGAKPHHHTQIAVGGNKLCTEGARC